MEAIQNPPALRHIVREERVDSDLPEDNIKQAVQQAPTEVNLPEVHPAFGYLLELFSLSGQGQQTGYGLAPLSWQELRAFRQENKLGLTLWEREMLRKMSQEYCAESSRATSPKRPAPYSPEIEEEDEQEVKIVIAQNIMAGMAAFRQNQKGV